MSEATEKAASSPRKLSDAIREVKNAVADRDDVVVELREAQKTRIELLAAELAPVFAEVPAELDMFDFAVSSGVQPRLWIDAISHVTMGRDRRTYRFLRDTRLGRVVLAESTEIKPVADQVARYIAERMIERERMVEGEIQPVMVKAEPAPAAVETPERSSAWSIVLLVLAGAAFGIALSVVILWERLTQLGISF
jgi:hypothetical protein